MRNASVPFNVTRPAHRAGSCAAWSLGLALLAGCLHGLVYVFLVPPWQHNDEPNHFETAWLVAHHPGLPQPGAADPQMSRRVVESMLAHGFYRGLEAQPDLSSADRPVAIGGYSQLDEPPLYYLLAAVPMRLLDPLDVVAQLYAGRLASLALYLLTILAAWGVAGELVARSSPLRWALPLSVALLPGFTDLMTSLNNDVGAAAVFSVCLWGSVRLARRGLGLAGLALGGGAALLAVFTKSTAYLAVPVFGLALAFGLLRGAWRRLAWGGVGLGLLAGLAAGFAGGDAAVWARSTAQAVSTRAAVPGAPHGRFALRLEVAPQSYPGPVQLQQLLPPGTVESLQGKTVTLGAWMWSDRPAQLRTPALQLYNQAEGSQFYVQDALIGPAPTFHAFPVSLAGANRRAWVALAPLEQAALPPVTVYYDGLVLVEGTPPPAEVPVFDRRGRTVTWGGQTYTNLLRNPSAETAWPRLRAWVDRVGVQLLPDYGSNRPSLAWYSLLDGPGSGWYYRLSVENLLQTFWGRFGWGHVRLLGGPAYPLLALLSGLGLVGAGLAAWRSRRHLPWAALLVLGLALLGVWGLTLVRGSNYVLQPRAVFFPVARYMFPAILPTLLVLNAGWLALVRLPGWAVRPGYLVFFLGLDLLAILSIVRFYY